MLDFNDEDSRGARGSAHRPISEELIAGLRAGSRLALADLLVNFTPGLLAGLALGWGGGLVEAHRQATLAGPDEVSGRHQEQ